MKEKLEELAQELIKEIKDVKDLTKKELPEVAKEYVAYNIICSRILTIISGVILVLSLIGAMLAIFVLEERSDAAFAVGTMSLIAGTASFLTFSLALETYLRFKMQPRRMAITAITSLFKGGV